MSSSTRCIVAISYEGPACHDRWCNTRSCAKLAKKYAGRGDVLFLKLRKKYKLPVTERDAEIYQEHYKKRAEAVKKHQQRQRDLGGVGRRKAQDPSQQIPGPGFGECLGPAFWRASLAAQ